MPSLIRKVRIRHNCLLSNSVSVAQVVTLGSGVTINHDAIVCIGVTIIGDFKIGAHALIELSCCK